MIDIDIDIDILLADRATISVQSGFAVTGGTAWETNG